jgi:ElaB/YqjD/DUF883 family membrane-anchored ribosome-binding protein
LGRWENTFQQAQQQAQNVAQQAQDKVQDLKDQVQYKAEQVKDDAQRMARDTAEATTKAIARLALVAFAAIVISALAAGFGGAVGTPDNLPTGQQVSPSGMGQPHNLYF